MAEFDREVRFLILRNYGTPESITKAIKTLYTDTKSAELVDGQVSKEFPVKTGVLQGGGLLAPCLFIIIDWVMKNCNVDKLSFFTTPRCCKRFHIADLAFADDMDLLSSNQEELGPSWTNSVV